VNFSWIFSYWPLLAAGAVQTVLLLVISVGFGFILAIGLALAQVSGPRWLKWLTRGYCTCLRGTPLLIQLWLLYYGAGPARQLPLADRTRRLLLRGAEFHPQLCRLRSGSTTRRAPGRSQG